MDKQNRSTWLWIWYVIFELIEVTDMLNIFCTIALRGLALVIIDKSTMVQMQTLYRQTISFYMKECLLLCIILRNMTSTECS